MCVGKNVLKPQLMKSNNLHPLNSVLDCCKHKKNDLILSVPNTSKFLTFKSERFDMFSQDQCFSPIVMKFVKHTSSIVEDCSCIFTILTEWSCQIGWLGDGVGDMEKNPGNSSVHQNLGDIILF